MFVRKRSSGEKYGYVDGARVAAFGRNSSWIGANPILDKTVVAVAGTACPNSAIAENVSGKVALITRTDDCEFVVQVKAAQVAGAVAVLIKHNVAGEAPVEMTGVDATITIPSVMVSKAYGDSLSGQIDIGEYTVH